MNKFFAQILLLFVTNTYASLPADTYWECTVKDSEHRQWTAHNIYQRLATNNAFDACKKNSKLPLSCHTNSDSCESFTHGLSNRPMWQCTALDHMAKTWTSSIYSQRDEAAIAAKSNCQQHSHQPEACYVNLITCKNINARH